MKVIELHAFGIDNLHLVDRPVPQPGAGRVLIRMQAASLNYVDLLVIKGHYNPHLLLPFIPVADGAGIVEAIGEGVTRWKPGDRIVTHFIQRWLSGPAQPETATAKLGAELPGVMAEYIVLPAEGIVAAPAHMTAQEAATLPIAGLTAWMGLIHYGGLRPGQTVLTQGTGGVSMAALQLAKAMGANVIATSSSDAKLTRLRALGADAVFNYRTHPDWPAEVKRLTDGAGAHLTLDVGGADSIGKSLQAIRTNGFVGIVGVLEGLSASFNVFDALGNYGRIQGFQVGPRNEFEQYVRALEINQIHPVIDRVFSLEQTKEAFRYMAGGHHLGKVVISFT